MYPHIDMAFTVYIYPHIDMAFTVGKHGALILLQQNITCKCCANNLQMAVMKSVKTWMRRDFYTVLLSRNYSLPGTTTDMYYVH